jgi:membrane protein DedA with SNARE-associated domain
MQFLKTIFWVAILVLAVIFAMNPLNQVRVLVGVFGITGIDTPLWTALFVAFLAGLLPTIIWHRIVRWSLRRRLDTAQRALTDTYATTPSPLRETVPPGATPMAPPPGVA